MGTSLRKIVPMIAIRLTTNVMELLMGLLKPVRLTQRTLIERLKKRSTCIIGCITCVTINWWSV